jgi:hypothetical protein
LTVILETTAPDGKHRAYTGAKGIVLPYREQAARIFELAPELVDGTASSYEQLSALSRIAFRIQTGDGLDPRGEIDLELVEEFEHFACLASSRVATALYYANRIVRWNLSHVWSRSESARATNASLRVVRYFGDALAYWSTAYPIIEGHFLARHPNDRRLSDRSATSHWHPLSSSTLDLVRMRGDELASLPTSIVGDLVDRAFLEGGAELGPITPTSPARGNLTWAVRMSRLLLPLLSRGSVSVLLRNHRMLLNAFRRSPDTGGGSATDDILRQRLPTLLVGGHTFDPTVMSVGFRKHRGLDASMPRNRKFMMDLWWTILRLGCETRHLQNLGCGVEVASFFRQRFEFYANWRAANLPATSSALNWIGNSVENCAIRIFEVATTQSPFSDEHLLAVAESQFQRVLRDRFLSRVNLFNDRAELADNDVTAAWRILNAAYQQI